MLAVGIDLVEVDRVEALLARCGERALARLFAPAEIAYARKGRDPLAAQRFAARFAAKEAFRKALGRPIPFREMEVVMEQKRPHLVWQGRRYPLSLTHTARYAAAVVVVPTPPPLPPR
ncbi:4'-phosphopantetheinyl transferase superfamily protein [Candidatus Bipolaricaulota bacterium]|nr:4'-phosphopantetheinyl transferase superfamily protein [Candidatus Bipolaricaulota bacterium]